MRRWLEMAENPLGRVLGTLWQIAETMGQSLGGVWVTNLLPAMAPIARECVEQRAVREVWVAVSSPDAGVARRNAAKMQCAMAQSAITAWAGAAPDEVVEAGFRALAAGSACCRALAALPIAPIRKRHLIALADAFETLSNLPDPRSGLAKEIFALRERVERAPDDRDLRDQLFDMESRTRGDGEG